MLPDEVIENADLLDLSELTNALLVDPSIPVNFKNQVDDLVFEYRHFLAIKVIYNDTGRPMTSSPSEIIHQVWRLHCQNPANYLKCCRQLGVEIIEHDPSMTKDSLQEKQRKLEMTKSRYKVYFPKMAHVFWEDFCHPEPTVENQMSGVNTRVKVEPHIKKEPPGDLLQIKTEPGRAKGFITVRSDILLKEKEEKITKGKTIPGVLIQEDPVPVFQENSEKCGDSIVNDKDKENLAESEMNPTAVTDESSVHPVTSFANFDLNPILQENLKMCGFLVPTPIQKSCLPVIMAGGDVMACSHIGSGKTAAYLVPIIHKLMESGAVGREGPLSPTPQCLIITATRELTLQIKDEATKLSVGSLIQTCAVYGGRWPSEEISSKQQASGYHIFIGTPRRLLQFVIKGWILVENLKFIVLDDRGFVAQ